MLKTKFFLYCVASLLAWHVNAQTIDTTAELRDIYAVLKNAKNMQYSYDNNILFPNGNADHIKGKMSIDYEGKVMVNDCTAYTTVFTKHFFYKADHRKHAIMFVNMDKNYDKRLRKKAEQDIFENGAFEKYADTNLFRSANVKEMKVVDGILFVSFRPSQNAGVRKIELSYDKTKKMPVSYMVEVFQPSGERTKTANGTTVKIKCTNFEKGTSNDAGKWSEFFSYNKGKLELKKYTSYTLNTGSTQK